MGMVGVKIQDLLEHSLEPWHGVLLSQWGPLSNNCHLSIHFFYGLSLLRLFTKGTAKVLLLSFTGCVRVYVWVPVCASVHMCLSV